MSDEQVETALPVPEEDRDNPTDTPPAEGDADESEAGDAVAPDTEEG